MLLHLLLTLLINLPASHSHADEPASQKLQVGDTAPDWKELKGTDGSAHSLADFSTRAVVVLCFTCNSCPYSVDYEDRMIAFARKYADTPAGVVLVTINANRKPSESLDKIKERALQKNFPFLCLIDETQQVAASYGAVYTPEFFVLNKDRKVIYIGAMDDRTDAAQVTTRYLEDAVNAALAGKLPAVTAIPARGCAIPYRSRQRR
ncbi:MAG: thioredoxin family protein [Planctomycetaceae bacterium]|jgi:peroxiredoxin